MIGKEKLLAKLEKTLSSSRADETDVVFVGNETGLTRYANSTIHQNVFENNSRIIFRSVIGKKIGVASTNSLLSADLKQTLNNSYAIAEKQTDNSDFAGLAKPATIKDINTYDDKTARFTPNQRALIIKKIIKATDQKSFTLAGAFATSSGEIAIVNSNGIRIYQPVSSASINMIAMSDSSSGYSAGLSRRVEDIDFDMLTSRAIEKCDRSQDPQSVEPGDYEVILEPAAVAALLEWINYIGFGSKSFQEKTSFMAGKIGKKITSDMISIFDDGLDEGSIAFPFDFEGSPKKKTKLIDKGIARGVVYDRMAAKKGKTRSTGHALMPDQTGEGALALNLTMAGGRASRDKMIASVKKGILITRFHYINGFIDTPNAVLTGMTRDGTFLIEKGEITGGIKNLRFTDAMMRAFNSTVAVSKESELVESWWSSVGCVKAPTVQLGSFRFSGKTEF